MTHSNRISRALFPVVFFLSAAGAGASGLENLLPCPSFEKDVNEDGLADGWDANIHQGATGRFSLDAGHKRHGNVAQHIEHTNDSTEWVRASAEPIPAKGERAYHAEGWVRADGAWSVLLYEFFTTEGKAYRTHQIASGKATDWVRVGKTVTTETDASHFKLSLITIGKGEAWFDDFSLVALEDVPSLRILPLPVAPAIDGVLDDKAWGHAVVIDGLFLLGGNGERAEPGCAVRIGFHEGMLYVGWRNQEPRMADLVLSEPAGWQDDTVEVFLAPEEGEGVYYQFGLTAAGAVLEDHRLSQPGTGYYVDWYSAQTTARVAPTLPCVAAARKGDDHWTGEMAIDVAQASERLRPGQIWRLQLARSRKLRDLVQNSCWAYTPGETFHQPDRFGRTVFPLYGRATPEIITSPEPVPPTQLRVIPCPQKLTPGVGAPRRLTSPLRIAVATVDKPSAVAHVLVGIFAKMGLDTRLTAASSEQEADIVLGAPPDHAGLKSLGVALKDAGPALEPWQVSEAYALDTTGKAIALCATGERGLLYGVQTLRQLLHCDGQTVWLQPARVLDWPDLEWRGWHLIGPEDSRSLTSAKRVIDVLAALKMNWVAFQIDNRLQYTRDPDLACEGAPTKAELAALVRYAEGYLMEVIPMTQCWSHFSRFLGKQKYRHLAEIQQPEPEARRKYWNYCPRHPDTHPMLFGMIEEQLECFPHARFFHCGLDEITFEPIGVCERCKGTPGGELLAEEVKRLHTFLAGKGLTMCMWGDQLLVEHNGKAPYNTADALPKLPRDIVIFDWHYSAWQEFPSVKFFKDQGFPVIASGWYEPLNVTTLSQTARDQGVMGYGGTTWYGIDKIRSEIRLMCGMTLSAENTWSAAKPTVDRITYEPAEIFRHLWEDKPAPRPQSYALIDLSNYANRRLADTQMRLGWLGLGPDSDLSALPTGRQWFGGVPFAVPPAGNNQCLVLAGDGDNERLFPLRAWQVPVNIRARKLAFLQTCSRPERFSRHIYDRRRVNPSKVVRYLVRYSDDQTEEVTLNWNREISDWNSQLGSAYARTGWRGKTRNGALARVEVFEWLNPRPEVTIRALDIISLQSTVRPVVLGITAMQ